MQGKSLIKIKANLGFVRNNKSYFCSISQPKLDESLKERIIYDGVIYNHHSRYVCEIILNQPKSLNSLDLKIHEI